MGYATITDLIDRYGEEELAQRTDHVAGQTIDSSIVARALSDADAEIDSCLAGRYALPVTSVPPLLVIVACQIARYHLHADGAPKRVIDDRQDALRVLSEIRSGVRQLPLAATAGGGTAPEAASTSGMATVRAPQRVFTEELLSRFGRF